MNRRILIVIGVLLVFVGSGWGYWAYRQYRSYQTLIPGDATAVVRIHVDALIRDIAWNAWWNPAYYSGVSRDTTSAIDRDKWKQTGMDIPANLFLYQVEHPLSGTFPKVYFGSIALTDTASFSGWLSNRLHMPIQRDSLGEFAIGDHIVVITKGKRAFFAFTPTKPMADLSLLRKTVWSLSTSKNFTPVSKSPFGDISDAKGHISIKDGHVSSFTFHTGEVVFSSAHTLDNPPTLDEKIPDFPDSNAVSLWLQDIPSGWLARKQFRIGPNTLHGDSLLVHGKGSVAFVWNGTVTQQDTVISYDYDENFVMQERVELTEKPAPALYLTLTAGDGLNRYLQVQGILDPGTHRVNREILPLYQVKTSSLAGGYLQFHTADSAAELPALRAINQQFLFLRINFERIDPLALPSAISPVVAICSSLEASGYCEDSNRIAIRGKLRMKDRRINSLIQLLGISP